MFFTCFACNIYHIVCVVLSNDDIFSHFSSYLEHAEIVGSMANELDLSNGAHEWNSDGFIKKFEWFAWFKQNCKTGIVGDLYITLCEHFTQKTWYNEHKRDSNGHFRLDQVSNLMTRQNMNVNQVLPTQSKRREIRKVHLNNPQPKTKFNKNKCLGKSKWPKKIQYHIPHYPPTKYKYRNIDKQLLKCRKPPSSVYQK